MIITIIMACHFIFLIFLLSSLIFSATSQSNFPVAKPNCTDHCGNISIPFPFGTNENCYQHYSFFVTCNQTSNPPKLFMQNSSIEIIEILPDGQLKLLQYVAQNCYARNGTRVSHNQPFIKLPYFINVNNTANRFTILGCDAYYGYVYGRRRGNKNYTTGCTAMCSGTDELTEKSCGGLGCCQTSIPNDVWRVDINLKSYNNHTEVWEFDKCSYGFVVEDRSFTFFADNLTNFRDVKKLPMVADWAIGNATTCEEAQKNSSYACRGPNTESYKPSNGYGYRCQCVRGYQGNPYLDIGCTDIDECSAGGTHNCTTAKNCKNIPGSFKCFCPKGYRGDGTDTCLRGESLIYKLAAGIALGIVVLLLASCFLYLELQRRDSDKKKRMFFKQNGGMLLQAKVKKRNISRDMAEIYTETKLKKATNNFHKTMIVGQGGHGTVYKGLLEDKKIVAIKKSKKEVDQTEIQEFINEVFLLSQVDHPNIVKLLGCCLETQTPLLVYEFISNGTLFEHIHNEHKRRYLDWNMRLKIAIETANVLSYLHSDVSTPIVHRDVKSANILLDRDFTARVSDFGASRLVHLDKTQLSTAVQGTVGYLDPEYLQTSQLNEKSDVYSFGVVLVELLTGRKALIYEKPENERNLANYFLYMLKQKRVFEVFDDYIVQGGNGEHLIEVARVAQGCLNVKAEDRPSMKEVAMELKGMQLSGKHSWAKNNEKNSEEMEFLLGERSNVGFDGYNASTRNYSLTDDSLKDHIGLLPITGGR